MNETSVAVAYSNEAEIRSNGTLVNLTEEKRVRTIPNILRRRGSRSPNNETIDVPIRDTVFVVGHTETRFIGEFGDMSNPETVSNAKCIKFAGGSGIRRKQELSMKDLSEDYLDWILCVSSTPTKAESQELDTVGTFSSIGENGSDCDVLSTSQGSDYCKINSLSQLSDYSQMNSSSQRSDNSKINSSSQHSADSEVHSGSQQVDDHQVPSTSQLPSLQSSLEFSLNDNNNWMDIQSVVEVNLEQGGTNGTKPRASEIKEKKLNKVCHPLKKENKNLKISTQINVPCCWICGKTYKSRSSLSHHQKRVHDFSNRIVEPSIELTCDWCSKKYRRVSAYQKHLNIHLREAKQSISSVFLM